MPPFAAAFRFVVRHPGRFAWRVLKSFRANQGVLLSGAVAYYTLLSVVPLFSLVLVALSHVVDQERLLAVFGEAIAVLVPGQSSAVTAEVATFLDHRDVVGVFGFAVMLFFSSFAFTVLENAMAVIFHHRIRRDTRHFLTSAVLPFVFIALLGLGLLLVTFISGLVQAARAGSLSLGDVSVELDAAGAAAVYTLGVAGLIMMLTAIYLVMPVGKISFRHALLGGVTAGVLWEGMRHVLVWYFSTLSMVNVIYGSLTTAVVALLSLEVAGMIVLLGAQVIAEYERIDDELKETEGE
jgi:YihY family inner membrane protein